MSTLSISLSRINLYTSMLKSISSTLLDRSSFTSAVSPRASRAPVYVRRLGINQRERESNYGLWWHKCIKAVHRSLSIVEYSRSNNTRKPSHSKSISPACYDYNNNNNAVRPSISLSPRYRNDKRLAQFSHNNYGLCLQRCINDVQLSISRSSYYYSSNARNQRHERSNSPKRGDINKHANEQRPCLALSSNSTYNKRSTQGC